MRPANMLSAEAAKAIALSEARLTAARYLKVELLPEQQPLYCLNYTTNELRYCCYIDALTGELLGLDSRPCEI